MQNLLGIHRSIHYLPLTEKAPLWAAVKAHQPQASKRLAEYNERSVNQALMWRQARTLPTQLRLPPLIFNPYAALFAGL